MVNQNQNQEQLLIRKEKYGNNLVSCENIFASEIIQNQLKLLEQIKQKLLNLIEIFHNNDRL